VVVTLEEMIRKHGVCAKLKHAVVAARGWRRENLKTGDPGEWYERWPVFSLELEAAIQATKDPQ
jgi:hypothetical protein